MQSRQKTILAVLLLLLGLAATGLVLTSGLVNPVLRQSPGQQNAARHWTPVDQGPMLTAQNLAALAETHREQYFASEALRIADQDIDLAFAIALRNAAAHPTPLTPEGRQLQARVKELEAQTNGDQAEVSRLTKLVASGRGDEKENLDAQLQIVQAQLALDQDELGDARRDLIRVGGDEASKIKQAMAEYESSLAHATANPGGSGSTASPAATTANTASNASGVLAQWRTWDGLRAKLKQLHQAQSEAKARAADLTQTHNSLEQELASMKSEKTALVQQAKGLLAAKNDSSEATATALSYVRQLTQRQQNLADYDQRIDAEQKLSDLYSRWAALVWSRELTSGHRLIKSALWIVLIILLAFVVDFFCSRFFSDLTLDRGRLVTARYLLRFFVRALALGLILIVLFGPPSQLATIVALAGAGLTVALKDFVVGFFGWFVLMGRNGVRPGDWVEINGVQGKVLEVGLLHTVVLETGNWTEAGHPTGRKVAFVNSYAIEGHYFNFSTAGQWLWDSIQIGVPAGTDPLPVVEAIQKLVARETEANSKLAEQEWKHAATFSGLRSFSAAPTISVRPTNSGVNLMVRYIARADDQDELRARLYRAIYQFLIGKGQPEAEPAEQPSPARG
jgi:small-conductance mechanosensitive channel/uncharacterized coiled-coil DUF342 family protein